jgi:predicted acyl esterase
MSDGDSSKPAVRRRDVLIGSIAIAGVMGGWYAKKRYFTKWPGADIAPQSERLPMRIYGDDAYPVFFRRPLPPDSPPARYPGFNPGSTLLKKGTIRRKGAMPLACDMVFERDVAVTLRDGKTLYTDVFRPADDGQYPAIVAWSPYGKEIGGQWLDDVPFRAGVSLSLVSELQKFEGPDPALYVNRGYVILNPDARGAYGSGGNINFWGRQVAEDGYDFIEWAAVQKWSSGKVAMAGNSWLAISQWFIAAEKPPHLAAIAPWEGASEKYLPGGIPVVTFDEVIIQSFAGKNLVEDIPKMTLEHPLMDPYWQDKSAKLESIDVPAYVVASYTNAAHTQGTFAGFRRIASQEKWLRVHNTQEWRDFYDPIHAKDLLRFFDHYLKGVANGWETTPKVRLAVLDPGGADVVDRTETSWPLERQRHTALYLKTDKSLSATADSQEGQLRYAATGGDSAEFRLTFDQDTEIIGYMSLRLWVEAVGSDDMDLAVSVEKLDSSGKKIPGPPGGPPGMTISASALLRVSHRELDPARSTPSEPVQSHLRELLLKPGEIVAVDIAIWPMGMRYRAGERLQLKVTGFGNDGKFPLAFGTAKVPVPLSGGTFDPDTRPELLVLGGPEYTKPAYVKQQQVPSPGSRNRGSHLLHMGGQFDSHLLIPVIPKPT